MFWPTDPIPRVGGGGSWSASKIFTTMLVHSWFSLIWYVTWLCSEKFELWPTDPIHRTGRGVRGVCAKTICYHVGAFLILFNLICNMTIFLTSEFWPTDPIHRVGGVGGVCGQNICYHVAAFVILINLICNMTVFWKSWIWPFDPPPKSWGYRHRPSIENHVWYVSYFLYLCMNAKFPLKYWQLTEL